MYLLWQEGRFRLGQIAQHFGLGYSAVSKACGRVEHRLKTDRKFRRTFHAMMNNS
jgi:chromosomal replication initiation ATPase DnaA